jgi:cell division protein FtsW
MLVLTLSPMGVAAGGASRWLRLGPLSVQPLEFAKLALVLYLAYFFSRKQHMIKTFSVGFLPPFLVTGGLCLLLLRQPDFGGAVFLAGILFFMCLVGGTRFSYLLLSVFVASAGAWWMIVNSPYRFKRLLAFLNPFETSTGAGYQLVQSLYAFGSGQVTGAGLGAGRQKLFFLPEAHNDFIMAVIGEELGFIGVSLLFICLGLFLWRAFRVALIQEDLRDRLTAYGAAMILALGFFLNLAVVMGLVPPKGVPMPFVSYGGSSLLASFLCVGILLNLSRGEKS